MPVLPDVKLHTFFEIQDEGKFSDIQWDGYVNNLPFLHFALLLMIFAIAGVGVYLFRGRHNFCTTRLTPTPPDNPGSADALPAADTGNTDLLPGEPSSCFLASGRTATYSHVI